jgi:hypothetical protein
MSLAERMTFFLNMYHLIQLHAHVELGAPVGGAARFRFLEMTAYRVGRFTFTLFDIEYHIIRSRLAKTDIFGTHHPHFTLFRGLIASVSGVGSRFNKAVKKKGKKDIEEFAVEPNPLFDFALSYLVVDSPQVLVYTPDLVEKQLIQVAQSYLSRHVLVRHVHPSSLYNNCVLLMPTFTQVQGKIFLPRQFEWHTSDFLNHARPAMGEHTFREVQEILGWCSASMSSDVGQDFANLLAVHKTSTTIQYHDFSWEFAVSTATYAPPSARSVRYIIVIVHYPLRP